MRCSYDYDLIFRNEEYYEIDGEPVCKEHVYDYIDKFWNGKVFVIGDDKVEADDLNDYLWEHKHVCYDDEEDYNPEDEPEFWKDR